MNYYDLDQTEQKELEAIEASLVTVRAVGDSVDPAFEKRKRELRQIAKNTLNKTRNINIRLSERDLYRLKAKAVEEGIPYQTLASSILHKSTAK